VEIKVAGSLLRGGKTTHQTSVWGNGEGKLIQKLSLFEEKKKRKKTPLIRRNHNIWQRGEVIST